MPELKSECGVPTPKLEKLVHILDWVRIEEWSMQSRQEIGRKPHDCSALAIAFVAKAVLGLAMTRALIERLAMDRSLKRLCGFSMSKTVPDKATFSRPFAEFAQAKLADVSTNAGQEPPVRCVKLVPDFNGKEHCSVLKKVENEQLKSKTFPRRSRDWPDPGQ